MGEILAIWSFWLTIEKVVGGFCYHADRVRFRLNFVAARRGKGISIALTTGFTIAFTIRSVDRSLDISGISIALAIHSLDPTLQMHKVERSWERRSAFPTLIKEVSTTSKSASVA